jgi:hypothetical protein
LVIDSTEDESCGSPGSRMYQNRERIRHNFHRNAAHRAGMMRRVPINLPNRWFLKSKLDRASCPITQLRMLEVATTKELHEPDGEIPTTAGGHHHEVQKAVVHPRPSGRVEPCGVLAGVRDHHHRRSGTEHLLAIDDRLDHRWLESDETTQHREKVRQVICRAASIRGKIVHHVGVETNRGHEDDHLVGRSVDETTCQIEMAYLTESQAADDLLGIRGHPEFAGEEILISGRHVDHGNSGDGGFRRRRSDRSISPDDHEPLPALEWFAQPGLRWCRTGFHQLQLKPLSLRLRREFFGQLLRSSGAGDGIEDHQSRHEREEYHQGSAEYSTPHAIGP